MPPYEIAQFEFLIVGPFELWCGLPACNSEAGWKPALQ